MSSILTPISLWSNFDASLDCQPVTKFSVVSQGIKIERVNFLGRETGNGRVQIAAAFACDEQCPALETVLIFPDSTDTIDEELLKTFVKRGFSALMVDYRGQWEGNSFHTYYPENIEYANTAKCGRYKDFVDESADKTCWYEWTAVGIYARKYIIERTGSDNIAVVGLRDGGEIAWKLGVATNFSCIIPVCAAGWKAYEGKSKYLSEEVKFDDERYRFIAGIDSQAYAPYVKCPVLMLCSTNDTRFDYDRAYDTFSRINSEYLNESTIAYSVHYSSSIGIKSVTDMFMFLDKNLKNRQVFIPKPAVVTVEVDEDSNLIARANFDAQGEVDECKVFLSEDCLDPAMRDWLVCPPKTEEADGEQKFYLNVFEKTTTIFVVCYVKYSNGFTVWSKIVAKKMSGKFRNMVSRCRVLYCNEMGKEGFSVADPQKNALGGIFFIDDTQLPCVVEKAKGINGLYCNAGLATFRMNNPRFAPESGNALSVDLYCDETAEVKLSLLDLSSGQEYKNVVKVVGGVWQTVISEAKLFKTDGGVQLEEFSSGMKLQITCKTPYAINNAMWL